MVRAKTMSETTVSLTEASYQRLLRLVEQIGQPAAAIVE
jgi:hypothetical protein